VERGGCEANERVSGFLLLYASLKMEKLNEFFIMLIDIVYYTKIYRSKYIL
jgi:hypothetical protein